MASQYVIHPSDCSALRPTVQVQFANTTTITVTDRTTGGHDYALNAIFTDVGSGRGFVESEIKFQNGTAKYWIVDAGSNGNGTFGGSGGVNQTNISITGNFLTDTFVIIMQYNGTDASGNYLFELKIIDDTVPSQKTYNFTMPKAWLGSTWTPQNAAAVVGGYNFSCATFSNTSFTIDFSSGNTNLTYESLPAESNNQNCGALSTSDTCGVVKLGDEGSNMAYTESSNTGSKVEEVASA